MDFDSSGFKGQKDGISAWAVDRQKLDYIGYGDEAKLNVRKQLYSIAKNPNLYNALRSGKLT